MSDAAGSINVYDAGGKLINSNFITGLGTCAPCGMTVNGSLQIVTNMSDRSVSVYDINSATLLNDSFITGAANAGGIAVMAVPEPSTYAVTVGLGTVLFACFRRWRGTSPL